MRPAPFLVLLALLCLPPVARAGPSDTDHVLCHMATAAAERATGVPDQLLTAISRVESGRVDPETGREEAWPWTIDVEGTGHLYATRQEAIDAVTAFRAQGARSIDVGCMQINLAQHPEAFASLADAFDPTGNAMFAARFLTTLFQQTGSWPHAAAAYHSQTPELGRDYQNQVLAMWAQGDGPIDRHAGRGRAPSSAPVSVTYSFPGAFPGAFLGNTPATSPFGAPSAGLVAQRDSPRRTFLPAGTGRGLADYRSRPIAYAVHVITPSRF